MRIGAVISAEKFKLSPVKLNNPSAVISFLIIATGLVFGSLFYTFEGSLLKDELWNFFVSFSSDFSNKNKSEVLSGLLISNLPYICLMTVFGTCAVGTPAVLLLSFLKSAGLGALSSYIYGAYAVKGIEYCLLVFFPGKIIMLFAMLLLTQSCYNLSKDIFSSLKQEGIKKVNIEKYFLRTVLISVIFVISSLIEFLCVTSFSSLFSFS